MVKIEIDGMICEKVEEEVEEEKEVEQIDGPCPPDPRFQQQNKTKWCYHMFVDFNRCAHYFGSSNKFCRQFEICYKSLCPKSWIETWQQQLNDGSFPRDVTKEMGR